MMKILQFKLGGEYDYNVTFETGSEKQKIQTNENPKNDLLSAVSNVVVAAVAFFRFEDISAIFRQIAFGYPENGPLTFVLELKVKTKENIYVEHILKSQKMMLLNENTESDNWEFQLRVNQNNDLVEKIFTLREQIESYALGARMQQELPFDGKEDSEEESSLFDDGEDGEDGDVEAVDEQQRRRSELHIVEHGGEA
jgi:hypothetical protein